MLCKVACCTFHVWANKEGRKKEGRKEDRTVKDLDLLTDNLVVSTDNSSTLFESRSSITDKHRLHSLNSLLPTRDMSTLWAIKVIKKFWSLVYWIIHISIVIFICTSWIIFLTAAVFRDVDMSQIGFRQVLYSETRRGGAYDASRLPGCLGMIPSPKCNFLDLIGSKNKSLNSTTDPTDC